jgi:hypothetical protein
VHALHGKGVARIIPGKIQKAQALGGYRVQQRRGAGHPRGAQGAHPRCKGLHCLCAIQGVCSAAVGAPSALPPLPLPCPCPRPWGGPLLLLLLLLLLLRGPQGEAEGSSIGGMGGEGARAMLQCPGHAMGGEIQGSCPGHNGLWRCALPPPQHCGGARKARG